jgi:hypothetical protein
MNLQAKLDQFRDDNPYDVNTQAKRLLATEDTELILHVLALGLATAKQRQRHQERDYIKNIGEAPQPHKVKIVPGLVTGSIKTVPLKPSKRMEQLTKQLIFDVWHINGEMKLGDASGNDLTVAINREKSSAQGHGKNATFYSAIKAELGQDEIVRMRWTEKSIRSKIEDVYGEFRKTEAA